VSQFSQLVTDTAELSLWLLHSDQGRVGYVAPGVAAVDLDAIVGPEEAVRSVEPPGDVLGHKRSVTLQVEDLAAINPRATVTVDDVSYSILSQSRTSGAQWLVELYRAVAIEVTRPGYRRTS
jgi:hypothetical protein